MIGLVECECIMFASGIIISWIYLRFYQLHANGSRGDTSDSFSFASFFPNVLQPPINACFGILVRLKICKKRIRRYDIGASNSGGPTISISLPGVDNHDTERRRQIALKALKDRLSKTETQSASESSNWPSLEDDISTSSTTANTSENKSGLDIDATTAGDTSSHVQIDIETKSKLTERCLRMKVMTKSLCSHPRTKLNCDTIFTKLLTPNVSFLCFAYLECGL